MSKKVLLIVFAVGFLATGCTLPTTKYEVSVDNVQQLKRAGKTRVHVGKFTVAPENEKKLNNLTFRGSNFTSPYNNSYAEYLKQAMKSELIEASRYRGNSKIIITGELLKNEFDASGINTGLASISARIVVENNGRKKYNKIISVDHSWESSFGGATALPKAQMGYNDTVNKFLKKLFSDKQFLQAIN